MSKILDQKMAEKAINLAVPSIELALQQVAKRVAMHVIVGTRELDGSGWNELATRSFGNEWEIEFDIIAQGKFNISGRTGLDSRMVQLTMPELIDPEDVLYWGSVVRGTIVVACSGVEAYFDEAIANMVAGWCRALIQHELEQRRASAMGDTYDS